MVSKPTVGPNDKVVNIIRDNIAGRYVEYYRVLEPAEARVREIEVYHYVSDEKEEEEDPQ